MGIREEQEQMLKEASQQHALPNSLKEDVEPPPTVIPPVASAPVEFSAPEPPKFTKPQAPSILDELEETFGVRKIAPVRIVLNGFPFTLRAIPTDLLAFASRVADSSSFSADEAMVRLRIATAACAISHIKDKPSYEVFQVELQEGETLASELYPPPRVMEETTQALITWLTHSSKISLVDMIQEVYNREIFSQTLVEEDPVVKTVETFNTLTDVISSILKELPSNFIVKEGLEQLNKLQRMAQFVSGKTEYALWERLLEWITTYLPEGKDAKVEGNISAILRSAKI